MGSPIGADFRVNIAEGAIALRGAAVVASNELVAAMWVDVIPIRFAGAVVICDIVLVLRRCNLGALSSRHSGGSNSNIEADTSTC